MQVGQKVYAQADQAATPDAAPQDGEPAKEKADDDIQDAEVEK